MKIKFLLVFLFAIHAGSAQTVVNDDREVNIEMRTDVPIQDKRLLELDISDYGLAGNYIISGTLANGLTGNANNVTINYTVDSRKIFSEKISINNQPGVEVTNFKSQNDVYLSAGNHLVKVWVSELDGEAVNQPDVLTKVVHIASKAATRHGLIEEFTSSTCPPCAEKNAKLDPLLLTYNPNSGGNYNVIKYQMDWPSPFNDPSYNAHGKTRRMYYDPKSGIPFGFVNGKKTAFDTKAGIEGSATTPATVDISATLLISGNDLICKATVTPYVTSTVTVHQTVIQEYYSYNGTSGQKKYYWVMRKMNPDGDGAKNTAITDGVPFDVKFDHTAVKTAKPAQGSFDFWEINTLKYQYVVFLQDESTKSVLNSASALATTVGIVDIKKGARIGVYPNPSEGVVTIGVNVQKETGLSLTIYDMAGRVVYKNESPVAGIGQNEITINTGHFIPGVYTVVVNTDEGILYDKLVVN